VTLFLSQKGHVKPKHVVMFNQIAEEIRLPFTLHIASLSKGQQDNIDWWISSPMSRDNLISPLYNSCCSLILLKKLLNENYEINLISTDSFVLKKVIQNYLKKNKIRINVVCEIKIKQRLKQLILPILRCLWIFFRQFYQWIQINKVIKKCTKLNNEPITLIDTFIAGGFNENKDKYYGDLWNNLDEKYQESVYFVPTINFDNKNKTKVVSLKMSKSKKNFLFKEKFLKFSDYVFVFFYPLRIALTKIPQLEFMGFDIMPLIKNELRSMIAFDQVCIALLNYRFAHRLKEKNIKLRLVVNWFENQILDKGWNSGFRKCYPETPTVGYVGYIAPLNWLSRYPSESEYQALVIPEQICVVGRGHVERTKVFCQRLDVFVGPAFRFKGVWDKRKTVPDEKYFNVLVALPIMMKETTEILQLVTKGLEKNTINNLCIKIKPHPTVPKESIKNAFGENWPSLFEFVEEDFNKCVEKSHLLISNASSVCVETLAKGIPVIIAGSQTRLTQNPIPETITEDIWRLCNTPEDMENAIEFYAFRDEEKVKHHQAIGRIIRENYFEPVTRDSVTRFLKTPSVAETSSST